MKKDKDAESGKVLHVMDLEGMTTKELHETAHSYHLEISSSLKRQELIFEILRVANPDGEIKGGGVLEIHNDGYGFLRSAKYSYLASVEDIYVSQSQINRLSLRKGDTIVGYIKPHRERKEKNFALQRVETVNGKEPGGDRILFDDLTPLYPNKKLNLEFDSRNHSTRIIDLITPIGKGQRCLIVSPPRAGKTVLLQDIGHAIAKNHPEVHLIVLLIDERPEEVTDMQRSISGEVVSSTFDESSFRHVQVTEMVIEKAKRLTECGRDVVVLLDSITRLTRAFNTVTPQSGKLLSGGIDPTALYRPKALFGAARNVEEGGSLTIIGTALIDTGSRGDEVIFEEFKGTGNSEIHLDRKLMEKRIFPCLDIVKSGTRKEDLLLPKDTLDKVYVLRQAIHSMGIVEGMEFMRDRMSRSKTNQDFLEAMES